jgi:hypothetical protein
VLFAARTASKKNHLSSLDNGAHSRQQANRDATSLATRADALATPEKKSYASITLEKIVFYAPGENHA